MRSIMAPILFGYYLYLSVLYLVESYEFGYHPSSEEFDAQMREKTWTRDILWQERNLPTFAPIFSLRKPKHGPPNGHQSTNHKDKKIHQNDSMKQKDLYPMNAFQINYTSNHICANKTLVNKVYRALEVRLNKNYTSLCINRTIPKITRHERNMLRKVYKKCFHKNKINQLSTDDLFSKNRKKKALISEKTLSVQLENPKAILNQSNSSKTKHHVISKRSISTNNRTRPLKSTTGDNITYLYPKANLSKQIPSKVTLYSSKYGNQTNKAFVTTIHVTSEYVEPSTKPTTAKKSEKSKLVSVTKRHPCKDVKSSKSTSDEYDDYSDSDEISISYNDYSYSVEGNDYEYNKKKIQSSKNKLEKKILDPNSFEDDDLVSNNFKNNIKGRIKRKGYNEDTYDEYDDNYENDYDENNLSIFTLLHDNVYVPIQWMLDRMFEKNEDDFDEGLSQKNENRKPKYPQYTIYNSNNNEDIKAEDNEKSSILSWITSIFTFMKKNSWFGSDEKTSSNGDDSSWLFGWFDSKQRSKRTTTTSTTAATPILTIADPLHEHKKWIGILAQHIINSTANPLQEKNEKNFDNLKRISYNKYQIWRLKPTDYFQLRSLTDYKQGTIDGRLQWLRGPTLRGLNDVLISPKMLNVFQNFLKYENIPYEIVIFDVGKVIVYEKERQKENPESSYKRKAAWSWNNYYDFSSIVQYLERIQVQNPEFVELIHIGLSYEGRPLIIVKLHQKLLSNKKMKKFDKKSEDTKGVFIEAGIHGREWIAPASAMWIINELVKIMKHNSSEPGYDYIKQTTWYIMPVANPDSYEYSRAYDRFWKKTRSRHTAIENGIIQSALTWFQQKDSKKICFGVDYDLNWYHDWGKKGSSKSPCNELFHGPTPFSEPETLAVSKFIMENKKQIKLFISLQAYGQTITYPNKSNSSLGLQNTDDLLGVAMVGIDELRKHGRSSSRYKIDSTNDFIEHKSGSSEYFTTYEVGIPFSYTIYLSDNGVHGFILPSTYIEPTAKDAFYIIKAMLNYI